MSDLFTIRQAVQARAESMIEAHGDWPCRKGCDDCCRRLASIPLVGLREWDEICGALDELPADAANTALARIRDSAAASRPFTCPLLDRDSGACMVYSARPVECRTYGFYVERDRVLGCERIEALAAEAPGVIWGNHRSVESELRGLGDVAPLYEWLKVSDRSNILAGRNNRDGASKGHVTNHPRSL